MFQKYWDVLLVDDEPDVLSISRLAMKGFEVYGLPIKIHTAASKAEAVELLENRFAVNQDFTSVLAVAFIDVVMETDTAGLELCKYIRDDMENYVTQTFVRTGQPGVAPEREVIDNFNISGYISKVDATEDKLYTLVKSGVCQYYWAVMSEWFANATSTIMGIADSRELILSYVRDTVAALAEDDDGNPLKSVDLQMALSIDGNVVELNLDRDTFLSERDRMSKLTSVALSDDGDTLYLDYKNMFIQAVEKTNAFPVECFAKGTFGAPHFLISILHVWLKTIGTLWNTAR